MSVRERLPVLIAGVDRERRQRKEKKLYACVGRTVVTKVRGRRRVGRLNLKAESGAIFFSVLDQLFDVQSVVVVKDSPLLPILVLS